MTRRNLAKKRKPLDDYKEHHERKKEQILSRLLTFQRSWLYLLQQKDDEKCFPFHVKSSSY